MHFRKKRHEKKKYLLKMVNLFSMACSCQTSRQHNQVMIKLNQIHASNNAIVLNSYMRYEFAAFIAFNEIKSGQINSNY